MKDFTLKVIIISFVSHLFITNGFYTLNVPQKGKIFGRPFCPFAGGWDGNPGLSVVKWKKAGRGKTGLPQRLCVSKGYSHTEGINAGMPDFETLLNV